MRNKVQKNKDGQHIIVETENSTNRHYGVRYREFVVNEVINGEAEIKRLYHDLIGEPSLREMRKALSKIDGFATSNVVDKPLGIDYDSICRITPEHPFSKDVLVITCGA